MNKKLIALFVSLGLAVPSVAARAQADTEIRLVGSNTIGQKLAADLAKDFLTRQGMVTVNIRELPQPEEYEVEGLRAESNARMHFHVEAHGSGTGAAPMMTNKADLWMASRRANAGDLEAAGKAGAVNLPTLPQIQGQGSENVIALDALLILVHQRNEVKSLTLDQLKDIFSGKVTNWSQVGGRDIPITVRSRDANSGTFDTFCNLVMKISDGKKCVATIQPVAKKMYESSEDLSDDTASDVGGIGFVGFAYRRSARAVPIGNSCGGISIPSEFAVKAEEYPLSRRLYMYTWGTLAPPAKSFLEYVLSDNAQDAVHGAGFIDFRVAQAPDDYVALRLDNATNAQDNNQTKVRPSDVHRFEDATRSATRLPITFRFEEGSGVLDSRSIKDLERLAIVMRAPENARSELVLIGFTESVGAYDANRRLSDQRAKAVRDQLQSAFSITAVEAVGVGPTGPVACNLDPTSRAVNRRVEAWLRPAK